MHLRVTFRDRIALFFAIIFPVVFIASIGLTIPHVSLTSNIEVGIINLDNGVDTELNIINDAGEKITKSNYYSDIFIQNLSSIENKENKIILLPTVYNSSSKARLDLQNRKIHGLIIIPEDFSLAILANRRYYLEPISQVNFTDYPETTFTTSLIIEGDTTTGEFSSIRGTVFDFTSAFFDLDLTRNIGAEINEVGINNFTAFDYIIPGAIIFAIILNLSTVATTALRDIEEGQMRILKFTDMRISEYLFGLFLSQMVVSIIQVSLMFITVSIMGIVGISEIQIFQLDVFLAALAFGIFVSIGVTGIGILVSAVKNRDLAKQLSIVVGAPMAFLAGAFYDTNNLIFISEGSILGDNSFGLLDLIPARPAINGLRSLLIYNQEVTSIGFEILLTLILSIVYLIIGIIFFRLKHFRN